MTIREFAEKTGIKPGRILTAVKARERDINIDTEMDTMELAEATREEFKRIVGSSGAEFLIQEAWEGLEAINELLREEGERP